MGNVFSRTIRLGLTLLAGGLFGGFSYPAYPADPPLFFLESHTNGANGVSGLSGAGGIALSPDGKFVYAAGFSDDAIVVFARDTVTQRLSFVQTVKNGISGVSGLDGVMGLAVSPDGAQLYAASYLSSAVAVFSRNTGSGVLTQAQVLQNGVNGVSGLAGASAVAVTTGAVYVTGASAGSLVLFSRNAQNGTLTYQKNLTGQTGLQGASGVAASTNAAYVSSSLDHSVALFKPSDITYITRHTDNTGGVDGLAGAYSLALSPDGTRVFVAGNSDNAIAVFARNTSDGSLSFVEMLKDGVNSVDGLLGVRSVAVSADGTRLYATGTSENALAVFDISGPSTSSGNVQFAGVLRNGVNGVSGLLGAAGVAASPDNSQVYVAGTTGASLAVFAAQAADLAVNLSAPAKVAINTALKYTVTLTNNGPDNVASAVLTDTLPAGVVYASSQASQGSCAPPSAGSGGGTVTCTLGALAAGASATVTLTVTPSALGTLTNQVQANGNLLDTQSGNNSDSASTEVLLHVDTADLAVSTSASANPVNVGGSLTYTSTISNKGPDAATGTRFSLSLPGSVTFVSATPSQGSCSQSGGTVSCNLGTLNSLSLASVAVKVNAPGSPATLTAIASANANEDDPSSANNSASLVTQAAVIGGDVEVSRLSASKSQVAVGENFSYLMAVGNRGTTVASDVILTDTLPSGVAYVSSSASQGLPNAAGACQPAGSIVTCRLGTLDDFASASSTATVEIVVTPLIAGTLSNSASVSANLTDSNTANNLKTVEVTATGVSTDLELTQTSSPAAASSGNELTYGLKINNLGDSAATGVGLSDTLPAGALFVSVTPSQGSCSGPSTPSTSSGTGSGASLLNCTLGDIAAQGSATVTITVIPGVPGTYSNSATLSSTSFDPKSSNNTSTLNVDVAQAKADLKLTLALETAQPVVVDGQAVYTATILNNGPNPATHLRLALTLPAELAFVSGSNGSGGQCALSNGVVACTLDRLLQTLSTSFQIKLMPLSAGSLTVSAQLSADQEDTNATDNSASHTFQANDAPQLFPVGVYRNGSDGVDGLKGANSLALSPDGKHVYATGFHDDALAVFARDASTGGLSFVQVIRNGMGGLTGLAKASAVTLGAGGASVFVTAYADNTLIEFTRDSTTGKLTLKQILRDGAGGVSGLTGPYGVLKFGPFIYTAGVGSDSIALFGRDASSGLLKQINSYVNGAAGISGLDGVNALVAGPQGNWLYGVSVGDSALSAFKRDTTTGELTFNQVLRQGVGGVEGLSGATALAISPDAQYLYAGGTSASSLAIFRKESGGTLSFAGKLSGVTGLAGIADVAVSSDGKTVYTAGANDNAVGVFNRNTTTGQLSFGFALRDGYDGVDGLGGVQDVEATADGLYLYAASISDNAVAAFRLASADIGVTLSADMNPALVGVELTYTATVHNNGPDPATGITLTDTLPAAVTLISAQSSNGPACASTSSGSGGTTVSCRLGLMPANSEATVTIKVKPTAEGSLLNQVQVNSRQRDPVAGNNSARHSVMALNTADLKLTLEDRPDPIPVGGTLSYTLTVVNQGSGVGDDLLIAQTLPGGVEFLSAIATQGSCALAGSAVNCYLGSLGVSSQAQALIKVRPTQEGVLSTQAQASARQHDPTPADSQASASTVVTSNVISTVYDNTGKMLENHIVTETGAIIGGALGGVIVNRGLLQNVTILPQAEVTGGGRLAGNIVNQGIIENAQLDPNTLISGGTLTGTITGTASAPATIAAHVAAGAQFSYVLIDRIATLDPGALPGLGVVFMSNDTIPPGMDLSGIFPSLHEPVTDAYARNLSMDVLVGGGNLLADINAIPLLSGQGLRLAQQSDGYLTVALNGQSLAMVPWKVKQMVSGPKPGVVVNPDGSVSFYTALGREITGQPATQSPASLRALLNQLGLLQALAAQPHGNLNVPLASGYFAVRPTLTAEPAKSGAVAGAVRALPTAVAGVNALVLAFYDSLGSLREQAFYPAPAYPNTVRKVLAALPGVTGVTIYYNGLLEMAQGARVYRGLFTYRVSPGTAPLDGKLRFQPIADINGDGNSDFLVIYGNGDQQVMLYLGSQ